MNQNARAAVDAANVAIFAFRDAHGRPMAWPITPYWDGDRVVVTSTLAFMKKAEAVRADGRVALLVGGWHLSGTARVHADLTGDEFIRRFLDQELKKYPPARDILRVPLHRWVFSWYFGRVFMELTPDSVRAVPGSDYATVVTLDAQGFPVITPIAAPDATAQQFVLTTVATAEPVTLPDGPALVLLHMEPTMADLRQLQLRGRVQSGVFKLHARSGSLDAALRGWLGGLQQQIEYHRRAAEAQRIIRTWKESR